MPREDEDVEDDWVRYNIRTNEKKEGKRETPAQHESSATAKQNGNAIQRLQVCVKIWIDYSLQ